MKTMIRIAAGLLTASLAGMSTSCTPYYPVEVNHVYHHSYRTYDNSYGNYSPGTVEYSRGDTYSGARGFEPVDRF